jgi:branched-chain amino acid transport system substrate-binding protein
MITSLIGIDHSLAIDAALGAQQAVNEVNEGGGIASHRVQLRTEDDSGSADLVGPAYSRLATRRPLGIIGPLFPEGGLALARLAATSRLPVVSLSGADQVVLDGSSVRTNVFLGVPAASRSAERMLTYLRASKLDAVAVAHPAGDLFSDQGVATLKSGLPRFGAALVADEQFDPAAVDFGPLLKRVRASGARVLLLWGGGSAAPLLTRAWKDSGLGIPLLLSGARSSTDFLKSVGEGGQGALLEVTASVLAGSAPTPPAVQKVVGGMAAVFQRANHYYPSQAAFDGYAAARLLLAAIAAAGSGDPGTIDAALGKLSLATAAGPFRYSAKDHLGLPSAWLQIATVKDGRLVPSS